MPVNLVAPQALMPVRGLRIGAVSLGVREQRRDDLTVFELAPGATSAATFTRNAFCAAPVHVAREHLGAASPRYLVINAGNANAGTAQAGMQAARRVCELVATAGGCRSDEVLPFSTGVVGDLLDTAPFETAVPAAIADLHADAWMKASCAILTTDIVAKGVSRTYSVNGREHVITGIAKGSGMICPNMATMLAFVATDASVAPQLLHRLLGEAVDVSFNCITVDGDTSTNDACVLVATGAGESVTEASIDDLQALRDALRDVCTVLAQAVVRDGEGASKFIAIEVTGGRDREECREVAYTVAHSPLVKTAMFASDANWGRILAAVGRSPVAELDTDRINMYLGDVMIVDSGGRAVKYREEDGARVMAREEITVRIELNRGSAEATVWTCDLSHGYVSINADYRS
jgi:glutamate N-acetyltransferase/amino-acid N-acetyltransferase